ncbi:MAG: hypothetical protein K2I71_04895 [Helicobacter sp.]|nr:hypothetical protein [Helicobacter sp.]
MLKKVFSILALGSLSVSLALANEDVLALVSKGKVTSESVGVTKLNIEEKKQVKGGYVFRPAETLYRYRIGSSSIVQAGIAAGLSKYEFDNKVICGYNISSGCKGSYMAKQRFNDYMAVANYKNGEFIVATLTKTTTPTFFGPKLNFGKGGMVASISNGRLYKIRSLSQYHSIVSEIYNLKKNELAIETMRR